MNQHTMSEEVVACDSPNLGSQPPPNLRGRPLKRATKASLVDEAHKVGSCYEFVTDKYSIKHNTLRKYYKRVTRGLPIFEVAGRPTKLDQESVEKIGNFMRNNQWIKLGIHALIRSEIHQTARRRYPNGIPTSVRVSISSTSVQNWASILIQRHESRRRLVDPFFD